MNELDLVERIRKMAGRTLGLALGGIQLGIGDDCAIYRPKSGEDLLFTTDQFMEGVHFRPDLPATAVGERALARSLSDIAAMGGEPRFCLVSLAVSARETETWILAFYRGLLSLARKTGTVLAGGDLARAPKAQDKIHVDVMVCGAVLPGQALRRDGARPGDSLWVSGRLGKPWDRRIRPRLDLARNLRGRASACIDISDGLALDLHRMCLASGVAAELERVPIARGSTLDRALYGGDDYELLFTLPAKARGPRRSIRIGRTVPGRAGTLSLNGQPLEPRGYDHFSPITLESRARSRSRLPGPGR
jgi:thiamine-monophosphate kinase